ncbi:MAG: hypothetical protein KKD05_06940 [Candidatus Omnitrophica bacterium]|nr:hypothetical protein [Candidatus Omnitrophota bacterium]
MPDNKFHSNHKKKKLINPVAKKNPAHALKLIIFENSLASHAKDTDIKRASFLFNNLQRKIIKTKIAKINLN